jgi:hypothetical protein
VLAVVPLPADVDRSVPADQLPQSVALRKRLSGGGITAFALKGDVLLAGAPATIKRQASLTPDVRPDLEKAFAAAGPATVQVLLLPPTHTARTLAETMPELPEQFGGGPSSVLTKGCLWAAVGIDLPAKPALRAVVQSTDADAAKALAERWTPLGRVLDHRLHVERRVHEAGDLWKSLAPRAEGDRLVWTLDQDNQGIDRTLKLLIPAIENAREKTQWTITANHLKQIGIAIHTYEDSHKTLPPAASYDSNGRPLLSWRVHILPYVDENKLYRQFHLDESWDSPHNKKLIARMPAVYGRNNALLPAGMTTYLAPVGPGTLFEAKEGQPISKVTDGLSTTIMIIDADDSQAVPWTKPDDWHYDPSQPLAGLLRARAFGFGVLFGDGSAHFLSTTIDPELFKKLLTIAGGEPLNEPF